MNTENLTFSDHAIMAATLARLMGRSKEDDAELGSAIRAVITNDALKKDMDLRDVLAVVSLVHHFHAFTVAEAMNINPEIAEGNPAVFYGGVIDMLLRRAVDVLQDASGADAREFAWREAGTLQ
ncbi:hypothetical protein [Aureimonas psammosilenae]|uniref:hypothetical protein n=1 Tax=Aureimonas psammosilenae TaxID=2495496 RepID=UPI001260F858|nr:hypothetical protein [Aureimonas psammosilenae]